MGNVGGLASLVASVRFKVSQVTRKGEKPVASPALEAELLRRREAGSRAPDERDRPSLSTLPGPKPHIHEGQLSLSP